MKELCVITMTSDYTIQKLVFISFNIFTCRLNVLMDRKSICLFNSFIYYTIPYTIIIVWYIYWQQADFFDDLKFKWTHHYVCSLTSVINAYTRYILQWVSLVQRMAYGGLTDRDITFHKLILTMCDSEIHVKRYCKYVEQCIDYYWVLVSNRYELC